jgi:hypothetical protein
MVSTVFTRAFSKEVQSSRAQASPMDPKNVAGLLGIRDSTSSRESFNGFPKEHFDSDASIAAIANVHRGNAHASRFSSLRSIRGSGINQRSAANTYSALAIHELTNASGMAAK